MSRDDKIRAAAAQNADCKYAFYISKKPPGVTTLG